MSDNTNTSAVEAALRTAGDQLDTDKSTFEQLLADRTKIDDGELDAAVRNCVFAAKEINEALASLQTKAPDPLDDVVRGKRRVIGKVAAPVEDGLAGELERLLADAQKYEYGGYFFTHKMSDAKHHTELLRRILTRLRTDRAMVLAYEEAAAPFLAVLQDAKDWGCGPGSSCTWSIAFDDLEALSRAVASKEPKQ